MSETDFLDITAATEQQSSYIKVIGVGGAGTNAVNHMYRKGISGVDFIVCNTDKKSLDSSPVETKIAISELGAGNDPKVAEDKAIKSADIIKKTLDNNIHMLFIAAGMGGGTGTGASPVIAKLAKEIEVDEGNNEVLVVAVVTIPFSFEGRKRREQAKMGIDNLKKVVDAMIVVNTDKLTSRGPMSMKNAFALADDILLTATKGIAEIITVNAYINVDFQDVRTVMQHSGVALMGSGVGEGDDRANKAIEAAMTSELLNDNDFSKTKNVLLYISYSSKEEYEMTTEELNDITNYAREHTNEDVDMIWGLGNDDSLEDKISVTIVATGFESKEIYHTSIRSNDSINTAKEVESNSKQTLQLAEKIINEVKQEPQAVEISVKEPVYTPAQQPTAAPSVSDTDFKVKNIAEEHHTDVIVEEKQQPIIHRLEDDAENEESLFKPIEDTVQEESKEEIMRKFAQTENLTPSVELPETEETMAFEKPEMSSLFAPSKNIEMEQMMKSSVREVNNVFAQEQPSFEQTAKEDIHHEFSAPKTAEEKLGRIRRIRELLQSGRTHIVENLRPYEDSFDEKLSEQTLPNSSLGVNSEGVLMDVENPLIGSQVD